ncbi:DUF6223 family protein [Paenibacillus sp. Y412MC10]|uniref:DUF6223 family protein n=1 Tax=Geobacillus sp. (strain Y412MC10) TaxID=481743 RepID=UPI0001789FA7|nr:DUF6223 family protein [Paenibacillus sp. Y412MC10]ACX65580.1 conserved hypothetical protein [Paenibacillus sp. Y412MC10]
MKLKLVTFVMLCAFLLAPTIASAEVTNGNVGYGLTPGRLWATMDAVVGLISAVIGGLSLARSVRRTGNGGRNGSIVAMVLGLIVLVYAIVHLTIFTGDFGTGAGRAGAIIAIVMGLIGVILAGLTLVLSRRAG